MGAWPEGIHDKTGHTGGFSIFQKAALIAGALASDVANASTDDWIGFAADCVTPIGLESEDVGEGSAFWGPGTPYPTMQDYLKYRNQSEQKPKTNNENH